jgi:hypothetical protein
LASGLLLGAGFLAFMGLSWSVHRVDDLGLGRFGYAPFALPNALFMLLPHGLLLYALQGSQYQEPLVILAGAAMLGMLLVIRSRTNGWLALYAAPVLLLAAPVVVFTVLFRGLAGRGGPQP